MTLGSGGFVPLSYGPNVKIVGDGNSLMAGFGLGTASILTTQLAASPLLSSCAFANVGVSGQSWRMMTGLDGGSAADVDGAFDPSKTNILIAWEGTNSVFNNGRTGAQTLQDMADYVATRRALNPWHAVVVLTTLPRYQPGGGAFDNATGNAHLAAFDAGLLANRHAYQVDLVVDLRRPGSPWDFGSDYSLTRFDRSGTGEYWQPGGGPNRVHLRHAGMVEVAGYCISAMRRVRA